MPEKPDFPIQVFFDGACVVCSREIAHYVRMDQEQRLIPIDISHSDFDPKPYGITLDDFMYELHVIDQRGRVYRGVEGFWAIWQAFPSSTALGLLGSLITLPLVNPLARLSYKVFARLRPFLPKHKDLCESGTCRIGKRKPPHH
jgi:predicted DCC family thiol-disulfide oxidoreductase YuxK